MGSEHYRDLGGGVYEDGHAPPARPEIVSNGRYPSCPACGQHETVMPITSPNGAYYCGGSTSEHTGCGTLFDGTDAEWRRWRERREATRKRHQEGHRGDGH